MTDSVLSTRTATLPQPASISSRDGVLKLARGAGLTLALQVTGAGLSYGLIVALAHWMGTRGFGSYAYAVAAATLLSLAGELGLTSASLRFIPEYTLSGDVARLKGFLRLSRWATLGAGVLIACLASLVIVLTGSGGPVGGTGTAILAAWLIPALVVLAVESNIARAIGAVAVSYGPKLLLRPIGVGIACGAIFYVHGSVTPFTAVTATIIALTCTVVLQNRLIVRRMQSEVAEAGSVFETRLWLGVGLPLCLVVGFQVALAQTDVLVVGALGGARDAAIYSAAAKTSVLAAYVMGAVEFMTTPMISRFLVTGNRAELQRLVSLAARWVFFPSVVLIGGLAVLAQPLLHLFGSDFVEGHWALLVLLVGQLLNVSYACAGSTLSMTGHQRTVALVYGVIVLLNAILCFFGAHFFGLEGAAVATALSMGAWNIWLNTLTRRHVGVDTSIVRALRDWRPVRRQTL